MSGLRSPLYVEDYPGRAPATVWLHHGAGTTRAWHTFLPEAAGGRRAIAYDRLGFGRSPHERVLTPSMFNEDAAQLRALLEAERVSPVHLVGHSDGATVALLLAARARHLVLSVTVIAVHVRGDAVTVGTLERMGPPTEWPQALQRNLEQTHGSDWRTVAGSWYDLWISPAFRDWSITDELSKVRSPVLVIHDRHDTLSPPLHAETAASQIPHAEVHWVESGTHYPHRSDRKAFIRTVQAFWDGIEGQCTQ